MLEVEGTRAHHFRLVLRHPTRLLDVGFKSALSATLDRLSAHAVDQLRGELRAAEAAGLHPLELRRVPEEVDFWRDDFWNWISGPIGGGPI